MVAARTPERPERAHPAAGGPVAPASPASAPGSAMVAGPVDDDGGELVWLGLGSVGILLATALVVVRTLRR
jgi:hypothetical protein